MTFWVELICSERRQAPSPAQGAMAWKMVRYALGWNRARRSWIALWCPLPRPLFLAAGYAATNHVIRAHLGVVRVAVAAHCGARPMPMTAA